MARKKVKLECRLQSWADVDNAMRQISECERVKSDLTNSMNAELDAVTKRYTDMSAPIQEKIDHYEADICQFVTEHRGELDGKTMELNFGRTGFRISSDVQYYKGKKVADIIEALERLDLTDCIKVSKSVIKTTLRQKPSDILAEVGAYLNKKDSFWYETKQESIQPMKEET